MSEYTITADFGELRVETEIIDVSSGLPRSNPHWTYTDQQGHEHRYDNGYPTLARVVDATHRDEDGDEWEEWHYECPQCRERIEPGTISGMFTETVPGRQSYYLNDEPISKERFEKLMQQLKQRES
ncbi:MAG: hypothetical protein J2P17_25720 [Mycobacterium sp.]|nr:hypothetical protein [Mycobacterium sp.]